MKRIASLSLCLLISGCAGFHFEKPGSGKDQTLIAFSEIVEGIPMGITRRQLYAMLPPAQTPIARPPVMVSMAGVPFFSEHEEMHPLAEGLCVDVFYQLATRKDFETYASKRERHPRKSNGQTVGQSSSGGQLSSQMIDELLVGEAFPIAFTVRSLENPNDIVTAIGPVRKASDARPIFPRTIMHPYVQ